jgi:hypothetical protein
MDHAQLEQIKDYPFLIYKPYLKTLEEDDPQRKDHQRICLEMILSVIASISLTNYYSLKKNGHDDLKTLNYDLGQMSIGKWNQVARDTSSELLKAAKKKQFLTKEIGNLYNDKKWTSTVNELIKRRNADAHGGVLKEDHVKKELKERQLLLNGLIEKISFFKEYKFLVPINEEVKEGGLICKCKDLSNEGNGTFDINLDGNDENDMEIENYNTYLYHQKKKVALSLEPMIISYNLNPNTEDLSTFIYNKTINRKKGDLHFANHNESLNIIRENITSFGNLPTPKELCQDFKAFRIAVEDKSLINRRMPNIIINRKFKTTTSLKGDDTIMELIVQNVGNADAKKVRTSLKYPNTGFSLLNQDGNSITNETKIKDELDIKIEELIVHRPEKIRFNFRATEGGQRFFDEMTLVYDYDDPDTEIEHKGSLDSGNNVVSIPAIPHQVIDPNDPQSQVPVINLRVTYKNHKNIEKKGHNPSLGEEIDFIVSAENIGNSIAHDVDIHIFPPSEAMDLISGSTSWRGNINPAEVVNRVFTLRPRKQGIFSMKMRDVLYTNEQGHLFKTLAYEDHKILVKNDPKFKYQFLLEDIWKDLTIDGEETLRLKKNAGFTIMTQEEKEKIEIDVKIRSVKKIVEDAIKNTQLTVKQIAKDRMIGYCLEGYPFLIIDFRNQNNILILLKGNYKDDIGLKKLGIIKAAGVKSGLSLEKNVRNWRGKYSDQVFYSISLNDIDSFGQDVKKLGGAALLKRLANQSINHVDSHEALMVRFLKRLGDVLKLDNLFKKIIFDKKNVRGEISENLVNDILIKEVTLYMNQTNRLNLIVTRPDNNFAGLGKQLAMKEHGNYKKTLRKKEDGSFETVKDKNNTPHIQLMSEIISDSTVEEMDGLISKLAINLANARAIIDLDKFKNDDFKKYFLPELIRYIKEKVGSFHYRYEVKEKNGILHFYKGEKWPLYNKSNAFLHVQKEPFNNTYRIRVSFRHINKENYESYNRLQSDSFKVNYNQYWFYTLTYESKYMKNNVISDSLFQTVIKEAYGNLSKPTQAATYGVLKIIMEKLEVLKKTLKSIYKENGEWVLFDDIGVKGRSLGKVTQAVNKMSLEPFMKIEGQYKNQKNKVEGRVKMVSNSEKLIKSVLD